MLGWMKHKLESRLLGEASITSDMQMTPPSWKKSEEELKSLLIKVKEESNKVGLKLNSGHRTGKGQFSSQSQRKAMPTNAQNSTSQASQYMNHELPDVQAGFRKGRRTKDQIANIRWIIEKARELQRNI